MIFRIKAHFAGAVQREIQHFAAFGAKGRAGLGEVGAADRADARESLQIGNHFFDVRIQPGARGLADHLCIHNHLSLRHNS